MTLGPLPPPDALELFDTHCHLDDDSWPDPVPVVIARARAAGVRYMVTIGGNDSLDYARAAVARAETDPEIWATVGIHPQHAHLVDDESFAVIEALSAHPKVVGIGESGLDYYYETTSRAQQQSALRRFVGLARRTKKPLVLHIRDAYDDCLTIFEEESHGDVVPLVHCFTGTLAEAKRAVDLGAYISIPGIVTYKKAGEIPDAAAWVPDDRLIVETDAPWLAPMPHRGKKNEPAFVRFTAEKVAELRGTTLAALAELTTRNAKRLYGIA
jgi:TatD DNase family protein